MWEYVAIIVYGLVCLFAGAYIERRGWSGLQKDFDTLKADVENLKAKNNAPTS